MAETRSWVDWMKTLFLCRPKQNSEKKPKKWKCIFRRISFRHPSAPVVGVSTIQETRTLDEASEDQRKQHALNVAFVAAVAAAAEAAAASARAAAEVVRLSATSSPISHHYHCCVRSLDSNSAAIRIQTAFRAYLARKAFRALKALVRLQAIARGRAVRRRVTFNVRSLQETISSVQKNFGRSGSLYIGDCSAFKKEDLDAIWLRKQEAAIKREPTLKYSVCHQERRSPQILAEHFAQQNALKRIHPDQETTRTRNPAPTNLKTGKIRDLNMGLDSSSSFSQRSHTDEEQNSVNGQIRVPSSEYHPTYMAATESAKAKVRSSSTPRQTRLGGKNEIGFNSMELSLSSDHHL